MNTDFAPPRNGFHVSDSFVNPAVQVPGYGTNNKKGCVDAFGTEAGAYELVASYKSSHCEWFPVPSGAVGTMTSTTLDAN